MDKITVRGIVVKEVPFRERDRILHILTDQLGLISASAKGAMNTKSRLVSSTSLMMYSEFVLYPGKNMYIVDDASVLSHFPGLRVDVEKLSLAMYFLELTEKLCPDEVDLREHLRLLLNTIYFLEKGTHSPTLLKPLFELRMLSMSGYMPDLIGCTRCGSYQQENMYFSPARGNLLCAKCMVDTDSGYIKMPPTVLAAMRHIVFSKLEKLYSFSLNDHAAQMLAAVTERYLLMQTDGYFKTLHFLKSLQAGE